MSLSPQVLGTLLLLAIAVGIGGLAVGIAALNGQRRVRRAYHAFSQGSREDVLTLLERHVEEVGHLRMDVIELRRYADEIRELHAGAVSHVGTVRYDAFDDMGGRLSFSTAFLDERGDGLLFTAMNGRTDTRVYTKPVTGGASRHNLSNEERAAINRAMSASRSRERLAARSRAAPWASAARGEAGDEGNTAQDDILPGGDDEHVRVVGEHTEPDPGDAAPGSDTGGRLFDAEREDPGKERP